MKINSSSVWLQILNSDAMYNLTNINFIMYFATKPPYERVCDIFFMYDNFNVMALSSKLYAYFKEPPMKGYDIIVIVLIFKIF